MQWDRKPIFGHECLSSYQHNLHGQQSNGSTLVHRQVSHIVCPANNALACQVRRVSTSSSNVSHPTSFSWTINQINEFVSVDSLIEIFVQKHMGEPDLLS